MTYSDIFEHSHTTEEIEVIFEVLGGRDPEKLRITVRDTGRGFDVDKPAKRPSGIGGFGLKIIRGLMDEVEIRSGPGGRPW